MFREEANRCKVDVLGTCVTSSPIYIAGSHWLCVIELFKGDKKGIKEGCQKEVLTDTILHQSVGITDGIWALELSEMCEGGPLDQ